MPDGGPSGTEQGSGRLKTDAAPITPQRRPGLHGAATTLVVPLLREHAAGRALWPTSPGWTRAGAAPCLGPTTGRSTHVRLTQSPAWQALAAHAPRPAACRCAAVRRGPGGARQLLARARGPAARLLQAPDHRGDHAPAAGPRARRRTSRAGASRMFEGERINVTEDRAVLHVALRNRSDRPILVDGADVMPEVNAVLGRMRAFSEQVRSGAWRGSPASPSPTSSTSASAAPTSARRWSAWRSSPTQRAGSARRTSSPTSTARIWPDTLRRARPGAHAVPRRLQDLHHPGDDDQRQLGARLAADGRRRRRGGGRPALRRRLDQRQGGRRRSASTPPTCSASGTGSAAATRSGRRSACRSRSTSACDRFVELLGGAHAMDEHFRTAPLERNLPVAAGAARGLVQQLPGRPDAGASCPTTSTSPASPPTSSRATWRATASASTATGSGSTTQTGPIVWGEPGTNGQHAFYQLIHQGTKLIPCDFLAAARSHTPLGDHQDKLLANFFAQTEALAFGKTAAEARAELEKQGLQGEALETLLPHKVFEGNRPTTSILYRELTPAPPGLADRALRAQDLRPGRDLEHQQLRPVGRRAGQAAGGKILTDLQGPGEVGSHDASTNGLINHYKRLRG